MNATVDSHTNGAAPTQNTSRRGDSEGPATTPGAGPDGKTAGTPDVIVVGGGHNGLVCAAYLAKAGVNTLVVEARQEVGGCAATVSDLGARFNICNCDHTLVRAMPFLSELDLGAHGLEYLEANPSYVHTNFAGDAPWLFFGDAERTIEAIGRNRPQAARAYRRYLKDAQPVAELMLELSTGHATTPRMITALLARRGRGATRLLKWSKASANDVLGSYFHDEALIMPAVATGPTVWGVSPDMAGTGMAGSLYAMRHMVKTGRPAGGSGALTDALASAVTAAGGRIACETPVHEFIHRNGRISGVRLASGDEIDASVVVAACDPGVVARWVPDSLGGRRARRFAQGAHRDAEESDFRSEGYESKIDAVISDLPRYEGLERWGLLDLFEGRDPNESTYLVSPSMADLEEAHRLRPAGLVAERPTLISNVPSVLDPSMVTSDQNHVFSLEALFTPYSLPGGWPDSHEPRRWLELWSSLVQPGFLDTVQRWRVMTPDRYEKELFLHRGHAPSYVGSPLDSLLGRKPALSRYRAPISGLFLTGAGTFPGAGVWGASGRNTATKVLRHL